MNQESLSSRDKAAIWHPFTAQTQTEFAVPIVKGQGALLFDENGKSYIDAISSWWVNLHGHAHPYIAAKIAEQMQVLEHVLFSGYTHKPAVELAEKLLTLLPGMDKVFYSDDGSTSVEVALKMCFQYWHNRDLKKTQVIAFENAYHGDTFGSMSVGARNVFSSAFEPMLFEVVHIPVPVKGREEESYSALKNAISENTAAFIFEPLVQGAGGMIMYEAAALDRLLMLCRERNVLTIADEVMTGFGRTGKMFAMDFCREKPDITCLSKGITGGFMPLGVTMCNRKIYEAYQTDDKTKTFFHGHSYTANTIACTAAIASLEWFVKGDVMRDVDRVSAAMKKYEDEFSSHSTVAEARHLGTILALELKSREETGYLNPLAESIHKFFPERGVILRPLGNVLYVIPPYCITDNQLSTVMTSIRDFLKQI